MTSFLYLDSRMGLPVGKSGIDLGKHYYLR
jgi:hypothetical protein